MRELGFRSAFVLVLTAVFSATLFVACGTDELPSTDPPDTVTLSGRVLSVPALTPVANATVQTDDGSLRTTSGADGSWTLEGVPIWPDPFLRIDAPGTPLDYPTSYNSFPLSMGLVQYDLQIMDPILYLLLILTDVLGGADPDKLCVVFGAAAGFASMHYPQQVVPLEGATVSVVPDSLTINYLTAEGMADPSLDATTESGSFYLIVPDATAITSIQLTGTLSGRPLSGAASQPTWPGSFVVTGLIDPFFVP